MIDDLIVKFIETDIYIQGLNDRIRMKFYTERTKLFISILNSLCRLKVKTGWRWL